MSAEFTSVVKVAAFPGVEFVTASEVARRSGWSATLVTRLLGNPDARAPNPYYPSHAPLKLYTTARVLEAETSEAFAAAAEGVARRKAAARAGAETRRARLRESIDALAVKLPPLEPELLRRLAVKHYNDRLAARADRLADRGHDWSDLPPPAREDSDPEFLVRISVNYCRHVLAGYDRELRRIAKAAGRNGVDELIAPLKARIHQRIAEAYPWLTAEARRQLRG